jgi:hypothetical protein
MKLLKCLFALNVMLAVAMVVMTSMIRLPEKSDYSQLTDDLLTAVRKRPFEPFRIQVSDGTHYDVHYPEMVLVGLDSVTIGILATGERRLVYERVETVALRHVVKLVPLPVPVD